MIAIHRILARSLSSSIRDNTLQRCFCTKPKRFANHETSNPRGAYKSVHGSDDQPNSGSESTQQEQGSTAEQKERETKSDSGHTQTDDKNLMVRGSFENVSQKNRQTFVTMIKLFETRDVHRRNHCEFIYAALKNMREYGVHQDLKVYKALIDVMPKGKFIPTNVFQAEFSHYPKQQQCIIDLLQQMEDNGELRHSSDRIAS